MVLLYTTDYEPVAVAASDRSLPDNRDTAIVLVVSFSTMNLIIEIRAAEGGDDAKALVEEQFQIYARLAARRGL